MKNYSPKQVVLTIIPNTPGLVAGLGRVTGFATGTMIEGEWDEDAFTKETGADGQVVRILNANEGGKIRFFLQRQNPLNAALTLLGNLDRESGLGVCTITLTGVNDTEILSAGEAWLLKFPNTSRESGAGGAREYVFDVAKLKLTGGGAVI